MHGFADRCLTTRPFHRGDTASHTTCAGADDETRTRDPHLGKVMRYQLRYIRVTSSRSSRAPNGNPVRDTGIEPVTSSVSGKRSPTELIAHMYLSRPSTHLCQKVWRQESLGADDETRTRDPHLGKVMRYQLRYIRIARSRPVCRGARRNFIVRRRSFQIRSPRH